MIQTVEEGTGKKQAIPANLLARVERADAILKEMLRKVGEKIDINVRWWFDPEPGEQEFTVQLSMWTANRGVDQGIGYEFPKEDLQDDASIRRRLWTPIEYLIPSLDEELDRQLESIRRGLAALETGAEG
jgi:hypothetical protein